MKEVGTSTYSLIAEVPLFEKTTSVHECLEKGK